MEAPANEDAGPDRKVANSPKRTTDDRLPAPLLRKSRTRDAIIPRRKKPGNGHKTCFIRAVREATERLEAIWSWNLTWSQRAPAYTHTHTYIQIRKELFKTNDFCVCVNIGCFGCCLCTYWTASASSTRWPSLPSAPIGTDGRTCKSNVPIDVFQKRRKATRAAFQLIYCAIVRRFNDY